MKQARDIQLYITIIAQLINVVKIFRRLIRAFAFFAPDTFDSLKIRRISSKIENFFCGIVKRTVEHRQKHSLTRNDFLQTLIELKNGHVVDEQGT